MRKAWFAVILFVLLGFGVSLAVPAEDVPETPYDESETLPFEGAPLFSIVVPQASAQRAKGELSCSFLLRLNALTKWHQRRRENKADSHCVPNSLTILNHSFRC